MDNCEISTSKCANNQNIQISDIQKLHTESLQLRNHQFIIGTLALTGSGLSFLFLGSLSEITLESPSIFDLKLPPLSVVLWLFVLWYLFYWSMRLRQLIAIISVYLKKSDASNWEKWYYNLSNHTHHYNAQLDDINQKIKIYSQTMTIFWAFSLYGVLTVILGIAPMLDIIIQNGSFEINVCSSCAFLKSIALSIVLLIIYIGSIHQAFNSSERNINRLELIDKDKIYNL